MYTWQKSEWDKLLKRKASLPHALLLHGRPGVGKAAFAENFAHTLLCKQASDMQEACGNCQSCLWLKEGAHPDFKVISPENNGAGKAKKTTSKKTQISVAQIRQLYEYLSLSTHQVEGYRIIIISPAETLNLASANALLKMLEEPPANTLFLLVTSNRQRLLPTIISRCQSIDLPMPTKQEAINWLMEQGLNEADAANALAYTGGSPLDALSIYGTLDENKRLTQQLSQGAKLDPFVSAPLFLSFGMEHAIEVLQKWTFDLVSVKLTNDAHYHLKFGKAFEALCHSVNLSALMQFQHHLVSAKQSANHPLNNEMQLENILLQYTRIFNT